MMVFSRTGSVANGLHVCGLSSSPIYLIDAERPILFEAGLTCSWKINDQMIRSSLKGRQPEMLFLTHVHWDHCGGAGYLKRAFPGLKIAASNKAATILKKPNALALMKELSARVVPRVISTEGIEACSVSDEPFMPFDIDVLLQDGQTITVGTDLTVQVLATPGHTGDHLSYYIPEKRMLVATEACGFQDEAGYILAEFLIDYDMYLRSLRRLATLPVEILCQGHHLVFVGEDTVKDYFARSIRESERFKDHVYDLLRAEEGDVEKVIARIKSEQYDSNPYLKQPEEAYILNLRARIVHLAEKRGKDSKR